MTLQIDSGKAEASGFGGPKAALYVVSKAGYFPDVCEGLAHKHLAKGDKVRGSGYLHKHQPMVHEHVANWCALCRG